MEACTNYFVKPNFNQVFNKLILQLGIWVDGKMYWMEETKKYLVAKNQIHFCMEQDDSMENAIITNLCLENLTSQNYSLKVFCKYKDIPSKRHTSFIFPTQNLIFKTINDDFYLINGIFNKEKAFCTVQTDCMTVCEKSGKLSYCPTSVKQSAGVFVFDVQLQPKEKLFGKTWAISGQNDENLLYLNQTIIKTD